MTQEKKIHQQRSPGTRVLRFSTGREDGEYIPNVNAGARLPVCPLNVRATSMIVVTSLQKSAAEETSVNVYFAQAGREASVLRREDWLAKRSSKNPFF